MIESINTPIYKFYRDKSIFITGATGFLGKVLVEKLLRSCPDIKCIYILLRGKNDKTTQQRLDEFMGSEIFCKLKNQSLQKVIPLDGDLIQPGLGLAFNDYQRIINDVEIVFHSAASVRFDEPLKDSLNVNVKATKSILDLCHDMRKLQSFVHVSTAYAYCHQSVSKEMIYPMEASPTKLLETSQTMDAENFDESHRHLFEGRPNTYTFTKALAEHYIYQYKGSLPIAIARPSVITATWREPIPGWVDSMNGPCGACLLGSLGIARTMDFGPNSVSDIIPVDVVSNALITIAWRTALEHEKVHINNSNNLLDIRSSKSITSVGDMKVYNITSGNVNPITWEQFLNYCRDAAIKYPSIRMIRPPARVVQGNQVNRYDYIFTKYCSELLFAYIVDLILFILGHKRRVVKLVGKMHQAFSMLTFFAKRQWDFPCDNLLALIDKMDPRDREMFNFDIRSIDWRDYNHKFYLGIRKYLLKEDESSIPAARKRMKKLYFGYYFTQYMMLLLFIYLISKVILRFF